ncbi:hypothetical protein PISL3812_00902 [Talaromyces islandicus]|uniref:Nucleoporin NUP37 n=1 Tax=Talaromyces islandicus TaxID=28573 RepID=A0A0U1LKJ4_TALIS|nr:hypothetical protein PISL3812_00902 [Talaromyces islandicus]
MTSSFAKPMVRRRDNGLQLSYSLPHRVFAAKPYPVLAPNGSTIIVYGYDNGIRIVWRGGRPFLPSPIPKESQTESSVAKPSKAQDNDDSIMIIDSDDEEPAPAPSHTQKAVEFELFEDQETEIDPSHPYEPVIRHVDVHLGSKTLDLAVPSLLPEKARSLGYTVPPVLTKSIVVTAVCADSKLRIVTLPLSPPHPSSQTTDLEIEAITLDATVSHNEIPKGVSITFTRDDENGEDSIRTRQRQSHRLDTETGKWELLVATHAAEASGTLLLYRIPVGQDYTIAAKDARLVQTHYLPAPAKTISFNPFSYSSTRYSNLLVSFPDGYVKILGCLQYSNEGRRTKDDDAPEPDGKWLITLYAGFEQSPKDLGRRKTIVDAAWVLSGRAIMVLLADGEWGVWDTEGAGPGSEPGPLVGQSSVRGVSGGSLTVFSVSGRIVGGPQSNKSQGASSGVPEQRTKFAPMTPSTRRVREDILFRGAQTPTAPSLHGEISVVQTNSSRAALPEESILIRHGDQIATIPSLLSLWRSTVKLSGTLEASNRSRVSTLGAVSLLGERLTGVAHLPAAARPERNWDKQEYDILITAEHRLIILAPKLLESETSGANY